MSEIKSKAENGGSDTQPKFTRKNHLSALRSIHKRNKQRKARLSNGGEGTKTIENHSKMTKLALLASLEGISDAFSV